MKCGHCHANHATVEEVRVCAAAPKTPAQQYLDDIEAGRYRYDTKNERSVKIATNPLSGPRQFSDEQIRAGQANVVHGTPPNRDSIYTVVFDEAKDDRITIRFYTPHSGRFAGVTLVKYLYGPSNTEDYQAFAQVVDGGARVWLKHRENRRAIRALEHLLNATDEQRETAGKIYALESGNCYVCGRTLTDPLSIKLGIGPVCRGA